MEDPTTDGQLVQADPIEGDVADLVTPAGELIELVTPAGELIDAEAPRTYDDRETFLADRAELVARTRLRLRTGSLDRDAVLAELYATAIETRLALAQLSELADGFTAFMESGPGRFLGKLPGMRGGS